MAQNVNFTKESRRFYKKFGVMEGRNITYILPVSGLKDCLKGVVISVKI